MNTPVLMNSAIRLSPAIWLNQAIEISHNYDDVIHLFRVYWGINNLVDGVHAYQCQFFLLFAFFFKIRIPCKAKHSLLDVD